MGSLSPHGLDIKCGLGVIQSLGECDRGPSSPSSLAQFEDTQPRVPLWNEEVHQLCSFLSAACSFDKIYSDNNNKG